MTNGNENPKSCSAVSGRINPLIRRLYNSNSQEEVLSKLITRFDD